MKRYIFIQILLLQALFSCAQVKIDAVLDSTSIMIGSQTHWAITVKAPKGVNISFQKEKFVSALPDNIEILGHQIDTVSNTKNVIVRLNYTITAWKEGNYKLPAVPVYVNKKKQISNPVKLKVTTIEIDTTTIATIRPSDDIQNNPFAISEWMPLFWLTALMILNLFLVYFLRLRLNNEKPLTSIKRKRQTILPHVKALANINTLKIGSFKNEDEQKLYYTRLINILREYLYERFGINAMEMTSKEIINHLKAHGYNTEENYLQAAFEIADLVKFAKFSTATSEYAYYLTNIAKFIQETKSEHGVIANENEKTKVKVGNDRKQRVILKLLILTCLIIAAGLFCFVSWNIYSLLSN